MALVNDAKKEINAKIVYMGPKGSGKGAALRYIYSKLKPEYRSELKLIPAGEHQMLFFDFIFPQGSGSGGYTIRFHLYTLIAGDNSCPPWKMLLKGTDGLVFLADTVPERLADNLDNAALLRDSLAHYGTELSAALLSVQGSCPDMKSTSAVPGLLTKLFPERSDAGTAVNTATGEGLLEGLHALIKSILARLGQNADSVDEKSVDSETVPVDNFCEEATLAHLHKGVKEEPRFCIESAGEAVCHKGGIISVPLRLRDSSGESSTVLTLKISLSL